MNAGILFPVEVDGSVKGGQSQSGMNAHHTRELFGTVGHVIAMKRVKESRHKGKPDAGTRDSVIVIGPEDVKRVIGSNNSFLAGSGADGKDPRKLLILHKMLQI